MKRIIEFVTSWTIILSVCASLGVYALDDTTNEMPMADITSMELIENLDVTDESIATNKFAHTINTIAYDFVLTYKFEKAASSGSGAIMHLFGTDPNVSSTDFYTETYNGRASFVYLDNNHTGDLRGYFYGQTPTTADQRKWWGLVKYNFTERYISTGNTYDFYLSFVDRVMTFGVRKSATDTTPAGNWHWYQETYPENQSVHAGKIKIVQNNFAGSISDYKLYIPRDNLLEAQWDKDTIGVNDTIKVTFTNKIKNDVPATVNLVCEDNSTVACQVTKISDTEVNISVSGLKPISKYTADLSPFKNDKSGYSCVTTLSVMTDIGNLPTAVYTNNTTEEFDGLSTLMWEKTEGNTETGFTEDNSGKITQTGETAQIRMRKYFPNEYYTEIKADVKDEISFAMSDEANSEKNKVTFKVSDGKFSQGVNTFAAVTKDGYAYWYVKVSDKWEFLSRYTVEMTTPARPVISSKGIGTAVEYIKIGVNPSTDTTASDTLNAVLEAENAEIRRKQRALEAVNSATNVAGMYTALGSADLDMYTDPFFVNIIPTSLETFKEAYAELVINYRNTLQNNQFENLDEFEKYSDLSLDLLKISNYSGDAFTAVIDTLIHDKIVVSDTDYANNKAAIASLFKDLQTASNITIFRTYDDVAKIFVESKALAVLNSAKTRDDVALYISNTNYTVDLELDLTEYHNSNTALVNTALLNKNFRNKEAVQSAIDTKIQQLKNEEEEEEHYTPSTGGGGGGGGFTFIPTNTNKVVEKIDEITNTSEKTMEFVDIDNVSWARDSIEKLFKKGIINGVSDTEFSPQRSVTRAELVKMIVEAFEYTEKEIVVFDDVQADKWYSEAITIAASNGIINGKGNGIFAPDEEISRQDAALVIYNAVKDIEEVTGKIPKDFSDVSDYAKTAVDVLYKGGIIKGDENNDFMPKNSITRAEAACMICRVLERIGKI